jgi:hypothetical protein
MKQTTIAVDLDGVIHAYSKGFDDGTMYDSVVPGAIESLKELVDGGYRVVIFTARMNPKFSDAEMQRKSVEKWLALNRLQEGIHYHEVTNNKPPATVYIDDRAVRFENWRQTMEDVINLL